MPLWENVSRHLGLRLESLVWIGVCAWPACKGENRGSYKERCPVDAAAHVRTGWRSLQNLMTEEPQDVIGFLTAEGVKPVAIHCRMVTVYEDVFPTS